MAAQLTLSFSFLTLLPFVLTSPSLNPPDLRPARSSSLLSIFHASSLFIGRNRASTFADPSSQNRRLLVSVTHPGGPTPRAPPPKSPPQNNASSKPVIKPSPPVQSPGHGKSRPPARGWFSGLAVGTCAGIFTALLLVVVSRLCLKHLRRKKPEKTVIFQHKWVKAKHLAFLDKEDALKGSELIGQGGSGKVYKAMLESGTVVAIKKVIPFVNDQTRSPNTILEKSYDLTKNTKQIQAELKTLGQVRHRNLVSLFAYVPKVDAHLLIYEFMENGSLRDALMKVVNGSLNLTWPVRHKIAVGVATALKYLHLDCNPSIVHRDIKPGNILLDEEFEAHLGDFGLAKLLPDSFTHFTTDHVAGTVGYIAPEYHQTLKYTVKGDIYSFGVVLSVLLTGKEPTDHLFSDVQTHMGNWIRDSLASGREAAIAHFDATLRDQGFEDEMFLAFKVAAFCVDASPAARPSSVDVLSMLRQIRPTP